MASEYLQWKYRDVKPDEKVQYTRKQKLLNWWRYHVWWVLGGVLLLIALGDILLGALGIAGMSVGPAFYRWLVLRDRKENGHENQ